MQRNMDTIRLVLLEIEKIDNATMAHDIEIPNIPADEIGAHIGMLLDGGFIDGKRYVSSSGTSYIVTSMKYDGHDLIDSIRDESIWKEVKEKTKKVGGSVSLDIIKKLATTALTDLLV